jgi:NitT/TauT family transport system permease protein
MSNAYARWADTRWARWATPAASLAVGAVIWEIAGRSFNPAIMAPIIGNAEHQGAINRLIEMIGYGDFFDALGSSLAVFITGFAIALVVGVPFGIALARLRLLRVALESYLLALYATPMVALIPFILALMGFGFWPKVVVVVLFSVFPILYNTLEGARSIKPELVEVARSFRSTEFMLWRDVLIPFTVPFVLTGVRQATGRGLVGMVAAEFFLSTSGLGRLIMENERDFNMAGVLGTIMVITLIGVTLMGCGRLLENRFAAWRGLNR